MANEKSKDGTSKSLKNNKFFLLGLVVVVVIALLFWFLPGDEGSTDGETDKTTQSNTDQQIESGTDSSEVLAEVNGENITRSEVDTFKNRIEQQLGQEVSEGMVVQQLIVQKLITEEAQKNINMTDEEVDDMINESINNNPQLSDMTVEEYKQQLKMQGQTMEDLKESMIVNEFTQNMTQQEIQQLSTRLREKADVQIYQERIEGSAQPQMNIQQETE